MTERYKVVALDDVQSFYVTEMPNLKDLKMLYEQGFILYSVKDTGYMFSRRDSYEKIKMEDVEFTFVGEGFCSSETLKASFGDSIKNIIELDDDPSNWSNWKAVCLEDK